ncbi:MAG: ribonuclease PH [Sphingomonadaceae bacterium]
MRPSGRSPDQMRPVEIVPGCNPHAEGSALVKFGATHVLVTASIDARVPAWMRGKGEGWVTAEYGMLPRATHTRTDREAARGRQSGRTQEIQRLIGRSLRAVTDLRALGERMITIDCDVLQADGGTRTAAITGGWVALRLALDTIHRAHPFETDPLTRAVAAVSCGVFEGTPMLDLDYAEDSAAMTDGNFVLTSDDHVVEVQATAEKAPFDEETLLRLLRLARIGCAELFAVQRAAVGR